MIGLICEICGHTEKYNLKQHLNKQHDLTTKQYRVKYPHSRTMTGHSKRTIEYWYYRGATLEQSIIKVKQEQQIGKKQYIANKIASGLIQSQAQQEWNDKQAKNSKRSKEYYVSRGLTQDKATAEVSAMQAEYSKLSSKFEGKIHSIESKDKIRSAMQQKVYEVGTDIMLARFKQGKQGYRSKQEVECFLELQLYFPQITANNKVDKYITDMQLGNIVVEFYGDFWHRNPTVYESTYTAYKKSSEQVWNRDASRQAAIEQQGLQYHVIWESDWKSDKKQVIDKIKQLYENQNTEAAKED